MVPHACYLLVPQDATPWLCTCVWMDGETRATRWTCRSEGEGWSSCLCLSCLDIVTWFTVPQISSYILKWLILKEDKAFHSCCHKDLSLLLLQTVFFRVLEKSFLHLWPCVAELFLFYFFLLFFLFFWGFFAFPFSFIFNFSLLSCPTSSFTFPLSFWCSPLILFGWCPGSWARLRDRQHSGCPSFPPGSAPSLTMRESPSLAGLLLCSWQPGVGDSYIPCEVPWALLIPAVATRARAVYLYPFLLGPEHTENKKENPPSGVLCSKDWG